MTEAARRGLRSMGWCITAMVAITLMGLCHVALSAPLSPSADELAIADAQRLLSYGVLACASTVIALAGAVMWLVKMLLKAHELRILAVEEQVRACRGCAAVLAKALDALEATRRRQEPT